MVSLFLRGVLFFVRCLFFFWLGCLVLVFVVCLCWLLLGFWMGDTLGFVSLYSHAWEWTFSTNGLMTVRAWSAHGTGKKKKFLCYKCFFICKLAGTFSQLVLDAKDKVIDYQLRIAAAALAQATYSHALLR